MLWAVLIGVAFAQEADLGWLVGDWHGGDGVVVYEERWAPALGGAMLGTFRMARGEEIVFYELITIEPRDGVQTMRIKHFGADLVGWERRKRAMDFVLVEHAPSRAVFHLAKEQEWLVYERTGDALTIRLLEGLARERTVVDFAFTLR